MKNINLKTWGNVPIQNSNNFKSNEEKLSYLDIGNLNSYGDCCLPLSNISKINKNKIVNQTVYDYQIEHKSYLYGTPGKSNVTIGGAIASDTHGKDNVWGGSFHKNVKKILLSIDGDEIEISRDKNLDLFNATIGGFGLTGTIKNVELYKTDIDLSKTYRTVSETGIGIDNLLDSFKAKDQEFWVGWINLQDGNFPWVSKTSISTSTPIKKRDRKKEHSSNKSFSFIGSNKYNSLNFINKIYFHKNKIFNDTELSYDKTFFPLGLLTDTRNISKKRRIVQVQFSIPLANESELEPLIMKLINKQIPILCSIKKLAQQENFNNLSFYQEGWTVAVDFAYHEFNQEEAEKFYEELSKYGGKIYLAKDSSLDEKNFRLMYPEYDGWKKIVKSVDPKNLYQSMLSKRLGLKEW